MGYEPMYQEVRVGQTRIDVILSGDIHAAEAKAMQQSFDGYIAGGHTLISIDLSGVEFIDGTGLGALVFIHKQIRNKGGHLKIVGLQGEVKELFRLTELDKMLEIDADRSSQPKKNREVGKGRN